MPRARLKLGEHSNIVAKGYVEDGVKASGAKRYRTVREGETPDYYRATCRYRARNGYTRQAEAWGPSRNKATALLRAKLADLTAGSIPKANVTVEKAAAHWLQSARALVEDGKLAQQTWDQYEDTAKRLVVPSLGGVLMGELTTGRVTDALDELAKEAPSRARMARVVLKHVCAHAKRHDWIAADPMDGTKTYRLKGRAVQVLTNDEVKQVRQAVSAWQGGNRYGPPRGEGTLDVLDMMLGLGLRTGEALALRWDDVDMGGDGIPATVTITGTIVQSAKGGAFRQGWTKTQAGFRQIVIPSAIKAMLMRRAGTATDAELVFPARGGGVISPNNFRRGLREALKAADLDGFYPYLMRKKNATTVADAVSLEAASANLGHSDTAVTRKHYAARAVLAPDVSVTTEALLADVS